MNIIEKILSMVKNNKIDIEDILDFELSDEEIDKVFNELSIMGIEILEKRHQQIENIASLSEFYPFIKEAKILSREEELIILKKCKNKDKEAIDTMVKCNLRFVIKIAKKYSFLAKSARFDFLDLIQVGSIGILEAIKKFDIEKGYRFSTYLYFFIKKNILEFLSCNSKSFRIPGSVLSKISKIQKFQKDYTQKNSKEPSTLEISKYLSIPQDKVNDIMNIFGDNIYLYEKTGNELEDTVSIIDTILYKKDNEKTDYDKLEEKICFEEFLKDIKKILNPREYEVLSLRYGFKEFDIPLKLQDIADKFEISRQRIEEIEKKALKKIRLYLISKTKKDSKKDSDYYIYRKK